MLRRYQVTLDQVMVPYQHRPIAQTIAMQVLEARLGGPQGVLDAYQASQRVAGPDTRWPIPESASTAECAAVKRWRRASWAALDAIEAGFAHFFAGMSREEIDLARAEERLGIELLDENGEVLASAALHA